MAPPLIAGVGTRSTLVFYTLDFDTLGAIKTYADAHFLWPEGQLVNSRLFRTFMHPQAPLKLLEHITGAPSRHRVIIPTRRGQMPSEFLTWLAQSQKTTTDPTGSKALDKFMISTTPLTIVQALADATGAQAPRFRHQPLGLVQTDPARHAVQTGFAWFHKARRLGWRPGPANA